MKKACARICTLIVAIMMCAPVAASAWWNPDWQQRRKISLDTSPAGADIKEAATDVVVAIRLHTGNFSFLDAKMDGTDLRFVSADDKTPLKHHIELFDSENELAVVWVRIPKLAAASAEEHIWMYYGSEAATAAEDTKGTYDATQSAVFHFGEKDGKFKDQTAHNLQPASSAATVETAGLLGQSAVFKGEGIVLDAVPPLALAANGGFTFSAWVRPAGPQQGALLYSQEAGGKSVTVGIEQGVIIVRIQGSGKPADLSGGVLKPAVWQYVAVTAGSGKLSIYLNGNEAATAAADLPDLQGPVSVGNRYTGELDDVQLARVQRPAGWIRATATGQGPEGNLVTIAEPETANEGGDGSYMGILVGNLTVDAWVVIVILMVMMLISFAIMARKAMFIHNTEQANAAFLKRFEHFSGNLAEFDTAENALRNENLDHSSLYRLYTAGIRELKQRYAIYRRKDGQAVNLSPQTIDAIKSSIDAGMVREGNRLNSQMVLLTIAISGGPFLGLLGTVVGVMIVFASIAAAGDVNVNAIAPGVAAALLATVAGLAVAIPSLFGYNYLGSRIKNVSSEMHIFADEFITKLAEQHSPS